MSWLRELCPVDLAPDELGTLLTVKGVHVEAVIRPWEGLAGVVVARVLEVRDHPNSDKLCLARVDHGSGERELVVGVRNMKPGDLVPLAGPGALVPALPAPLDRRNIRGVVSEGMLCSPRELAISGDHGGILVLPADTPVGADFKDHFGLDDAVLDIEIEPNRPDLMSVLGVAREVAAATRVPLAPLDLSVRESDHRAENAVTVEVRDLQRCPRYVARIIQGVAIGPSPLRVQARLTASGMRPVSNVVDATNYAMLEMGQPLHPFDLALLSGDGIVVRLAEDGERLVTLDDVERSLTSEDLVIADHAKAVAIAGVMGSAPAEVHPGTRDVLLESAYFEPKGVMRTSRRLGLQTEASLRFGRGADPELPPKGAALASRLIAEWAGGVVLAGAVDVGEAPARRWRSVRPARASAVLGDAVSDGDVREVFEQLGLRVGQPNGEVQVEIPGYRVDLDREVDLIEEIARVRGYDRLDSTLPGIKQPGGMAPTYALRRTVREALVRAGLREAISLSFASAGDLALMGHGDGLRVANPISAEEALLRTSLVPALLGAARRNVARGVRGVSLFEVGHVFLHGDPVDERESAAGLLTGPADGSVMDPERAFDFFDAKGALEALMKGLGVRDWRTGAALPGPYHPARSAGVIAGGDLIGAVGEVHPRVAERFDLPDPVAIFEVDVSSLGRRFSRPVLYRDVPRFPAVHRDLAFVMDEAVPAGTVLETLGEAGGGRVGAVRLFDVFSGSPIPQGRKSLGFSVEFRAPDRTLTDEEADEAVGAIVARLAVEFGAELRSG